MRGAEVGERCSPCTIEIAQFEFVAARNANLFTDDAMLVQLSISDVASTVDVMTYDCLVFAEEHARA